MSEYLYYEFQAIDRPLTEKGDRGAATLLDARRAVQAKKPSYLERLGKAGL
jgi:hypothetical protein